MKKHKTILILAAVVVLGVFAVAGALTFRSVYAQTPTATPEPQTGTELNEPPLPRERLGKGPNGDYTQEALAQALGIDVETLQAAQTTAAKQALDQAVSAGLITQAQADRISERGIWGRIPFGKDILSENGIDYDALLAEALNISVDDLNSARQEAFITTIDNAVADGVITKEQGDLIKGRRALLADENFQSSMQSAFKAAVQQAVSNGVITQEQADAILQAQSEHGGWFGRGDHLMPGFDRHGRGGGFRILPGQTPDKAPSDSDTGLNF